MFGKAPEFWVRGWAAGGRSLSNSTFIAMASVANWPSNLM